VAAACAASPANTLEDNNQAFNNLVGEDTSGLDDLSYSSAEDDENYDDKMEKTARQIGYSDKKRCPPWSMADHLYSRRAKTSKLGWNE